MAQGRGFMSPTCSIWMTCWSFIFGLLQQYLWGVNNIFWGVNKQLEDLTLFLTFSHSGFQINKCIEKVIWNIWFSCGLSFWQIGKEFKHFKNNDYETHYKMKHTSEIKWAFYQFLLTVLRHLAYISGWHNSNNIFPGYQNKQQDLC